MAETQETIADIIANLRTEADYIEESARGSLKAGETVAGTPFTESDLESALDLAETKRKEADRLEAAHRREVSTLKLAVSSAHDALREVIEQNCSHCHKRELAAVGNAAKLREAVVALLDALDSLGCDERTATLAAFVPDIADSSARCLAAFRKAKEALAVPPRNCDVYNNESCRMAYHLHGDGLMTMQAFADWLFAPATEKEGEGDGR